MALAKIIHFGAYFATLNISRVDIYSFDYSCSDKFILKVIGTKDLSLVGSCSYGDATLFKHC